MCVCVFTATDETHMPHLLHICPNFSPQEERKERERKGGSSRLGEVSTPSVPSNCSSHSSDVQEAVQCYIQQCPDAVARGVP